MAGSLTTLCFCKLSYWSTTSVAVCSLVLHSTAKCSLSLWGWQWDTEKKKSNGKSEPYAVVKFLGSQWNGTGRVQITVGSLVSWEERTRTFCYPFMQRNISQPLVIQKEDAQCTLAGMTTYQPYGCDKYMSNIKASSWWHFIIAVEQTNDATSAFSLHNSREEGMHKNTRE